MDTSWLKRERYGTMRDETRQNCKVRDDAMWHATPQHTTIVFA
jgi:hypothetical protein